MNYLAKHNGTTIKDHSQAVALRSKNLATELLAHTELKTQFGAQYTNDDVINACYFAGLFHDIGKSVPYFQTYIQGQQDDAFAEADLVDAVIATDDSIRYHNEFSWAFVCTYEDELKKAFHITDRKCWEAVKYAIFWHHAANPDIESMKGRDIFMDPRFDINAIRDCVCDLTGVSLSEREPINRDIPEYLATSPAPYEDNTLIIFVRAVLIRADREVSGYVTGSRETRNCIGSIDCPDFFDRSRYDLQMDIVNKANKPTNIIAAPAGFGKTLIGLAWAIKFNTTIYWVCPRNAVIDSVYRGVVDLIEMLGISVCVEKMYTGKIQETYGDTNSSCPHIVVTNIDAITTPLANNKQANVQYDMMTCPMVFDEFHEFAMDNCPMYTAYNLLMHVRNDFTCASSLLVSATPVTLYNADRFRNAVNYLPKKNGHYDPHHNVPYNVRIVDQPESLGNNHIQVFNVVKDAQQVSMSYPGSVCFHSKYTSEDKAKHIDRIYAMYGKHPTEEKVGVASGPIIRASMDISTKKLTFIAGSPNNDMQTIGRCNRWGEYEDAVIEFVIPDKLTPANKTYLDHNDFEKTHDIYTKWTEYLKANINDRMTLSDLYHLLDQFNTANHDLLEKYQAYLHNEGLKKWVEQCYPRRPKLSSKTTRFQGNTGSLRNTDPSICFIVKDTEGNYVGPFQIGESYADFTSFKAKDAFRPYYKKDKTCLLDLINNDPNFAVNFPVLHKYLTAKHGKVGNARVQFYGTNPAMWRNPDFPFVVRDTDMSYDLVLGWYELAE